MVQVHVVQVVAKVYIVNINTPTQTNIISFTIILASSTHPVMPVCNIHHVCSWANLKILCTFTPPHLRCGSASLLHCIWTGFLSSLEKVITYLNACDPSIKLTFEASQESVHFLYTTVILKGHITTDLYNKPTDSHNYLLYSSAHPRKCKDSIPYNQYLRIR